METLQWMNFIIAIIFSLCYSYQFLYIPIPFLQKIPLLNRLRYRSRHNNQYPSPGQSQNQSLTLSTSQPPHPHHYAALICARNEEAVIADLINSLRAQTYDAKKLSVFVVADNCTDGTAAIARSVGATVYERQNRQRVGKGYALDHLLQCIAWDHPDGFGGYFVFDADNILEPDYIAHMNQTFSQGYDIVTSYRNSKNYGDNWISAGYALWFLRESRYLNHSRSLLNTSCAVSGTGFFFSRKILKEMEGRWPFHLLTEDIEFSVHHIIKGVKIGFCPDAVLYDEQPTRFSQSWRQRMRWAKGYLQVFRAYGTRLLRGVGRSFSCFDMSMSIMPAIVLTFISILSNLAIGIIAAVHGENPLLAAQSVLQSLTSIYLTLLVLGALTTFSEWKRVHAPAWKKLLYTLTFPIFMLTYIPISFVALFAQVEWKPIEHRVSAAAFRMENRSF